MRRKNKKFSSKADEFLERDHNIFKEHLHHDLLFMHRA